jgi:signal transduction histidine kinase
MLELPHSNNPLQASRSNLELTMDFDLEPDEHGGYLQVIRQEIERLAEITRRVLDFAQPTDDKRYPVSIARLTQKTLRVIDKQLELAHIQATTDFPADLSPVFVAPHEIVQVLLNGPGLPITHVARLKETSA